MKQSVWQTATPGLQKRVVTIHNGILKLIVRKLVAFGTGSGATIPSGILKLIVRKLVAFGTGSGAITTTGLWNQRLMRQIV